MSKKRQLAAIVFTDISSFTSMMDKDESFALSIRHKQRDNISSALKEFDGEYIKELGDGDLMMFNSAIDAVNFTLTLQNTITSEDNYAIRSAIHIGDVVREGNDIFGSGVNIASRIHAFASPGNIIISDAVYKEVKNKSKFHIKSVGEKNIKGIDEPMHMYKISFSKASETQNNIPNTNNNRVEKSLFTDLFERRVPQFIGLYFAASWGIVQYINWVVDRYLLSPYLVDLAFAISISMIPSILILSYFHGRPGKDEWNRIEKIAIPTNFLISSFLIFLMFYPKDLGAVTENITVTDENGKEFVKTVVKADFKKNIIIWDFENKSGNEDLDWLETSLTGIINLDLTQDLYIVNHSAWAHDKARKMGIEEVNEMPLQDMKKISHDYHTDYFITGDFNFIDNTYEVNIKIYNPDNMKVMENMTYQSDDIFSLTDEISLGIKQGIGISQTYLDNVIDLPVSEIYTDSFDAFKNFGLWMEAWTDSNLEEASKYLDKVFEIDDTFAYAHFIASVFHVMNNNLETRVYHLKQAEKYSSKLTQRHLFQSKIASFDTGKEEDSIKRKKVLEMWMELYPNDRDAYDFAVQFAAMNGDNEKMIELKKMILKINPGEHDILLDIGNIYNWTIGDDDMALEYYKKYEKLYPNTSRTHKALADFYRSNDNYEKADEHFFKAKTFGEKSIDFDLKYIENTGSLKAWTLEEYLAEYETLTAEYTQAEDTVSYLRAKARKLIQYGKLREALKVYNNQGELVGRVWGGLLPIFIQGNTLRYLGYLEDDVAANKIFQFMEQGLTQPPLDRIHHSFKRLYYSIRGDIENLKLVLEPSIQADFAVGLGSNAFEHSYCFGLIEMDSGNYEEAIQKFQESINIKPTGDNTYSYIKIAQCYNKIGKKRKAEEYFSEIFDIEGQNNVHLNYYYALFLEEHGGIDKAKKYIENAYGLYKDADEEIKLAQNIWKKYEEYQSLP